MTALQICGAGVLAAAVAVILKDAKAPHPEALTAVFAVLVFACANVLSVVLAKVPRMRIIAL